ncbi:hypothetical protein [Bradyrhizobium sp.]|uniref:hypothetical protein n=1 Tax=Bradyrhizobium sp. TaxID=376 RepID=UPI0039E44A61
MYNADYKLVQYCDGTRWISMGGGVTDMRIGTLAANRWCVANAAGTGLECTQDKPITDVTLTGDVIGTGPGVVATTIASQAVTTVKLADANVTYAKLQPTQAAGVLLGRGAGAGAGMVQELTLGTGLSLAGTVLSAAASSANAAGPAGAVQFNDGGAFGGVSAFTYSGSVGLNVQNGNASGTAINAGTTGATATAINASSSATAVNATTTGATGTAIGGTATGASATAINANALGNAGTALRGQATGANAYAVYSQGRMHVTGALTTAAEVTVGKSLTLTPQAGLAAPVMP